jgi:uncharacterized lipoprotein YddW (UPF0748 family)
MRPPITRLLAFILLLSPAIALAGDFRGAWVASVHNINFPSKEGLSADAQQGEIRAILDAARRAGLNALMLQVRPESDALYASKIEPWSRFLTGTQGSAPGYDPLAVFVSEGRRRGIGIHAWINPYRAAASAGKPRVASHISRRFPQYAYKIGGVVTMDPGVPEIQEHIARVIDDLLSRYDVAGLHFDDYFYPYPTDSGRLPTFPDGETYAAYRRSGGGLEKPDWRRENVNALIRRAGALVHRKKPGALFGVSPFGIYRPGVPEGTKAGVDQYGQLFSDPVRWMREGWIDYLAPQLYWRDGGPQSFSKLLAWWRGREANPSGVPIWPGVAVDRLGSHGWGVDEIARQIEIEHSVGPRSPGGMIFWNIQAIRQNKKGVADVVATPPILTISRMPRGCRRRPACVRAGPQPGRL